MKTYTIYAWEEVGGRFKIEAKNAKEAEEKALKQIGDDGLESIESFDVKHRDYEITSVEE